MHFEQNWRALMTPRFGLHAMAGDLTRLETWLERGVRVLAAGDIREEFIDLVRDCKADPSWTLEKKRIWNLCTTNQP